MQYAGNAADREVIQKHELGGMTGKHKTGAKFNVLLTSYEMLLRDEKILGRIPYDTVIIDEAHVSTLALLWLPRSVLCCCWAVIINEAHVSAWGLLFYQGQCFVFVGLYVGRLHECAGYCRG